jgi:hypothetical protein
LVALAALCLGCANPAWAHGGLGDAKSIWSGASHFLTSPVSLAATLGLVAALFGVGERLSLTAALVAGASAGLATAFSGYLPAYTASAILVFVGLSAVAGWKPSDLGAWGLALVAGTAGGLAADLDAPSLPGAIGVGLTVMTIVASVLAIFHDMVGITRIQPFLAIAKRVLGSWVAAIGLLMTTLAIHLSKK